MTQWDLWVAQAGLAAASSISLLVAFTSAAIAVLACRSRVLVSIEGVLWALVGATGFALAAGVVAPNPWTDPLADPLGWIAAQSTETNFYLACGVLVILWADFVYRAAPRHSAITPMTQGSGE